MKVGSLRPGSYFVTLVSKRMGTVMGTLKANNKHTHGVPVYLEDPEEDKLIHEDVWVETEQIH